MPRSSSRGWSLAELLVAVSIVAVLVSLAFPAYNFIKAKLQFATCVGNLKAIHAGLSVHLQDHGMVWPQYPIDFSDEGEGDEEDEQDKMSQWWYEALKPYGVPRKTWLCPADRYGHEHDESGSSRFMASYGVTLFDDTPNNAYRWFQPWVIENGQNHGKNQGPNMIMPDGEVRQGIGIDLRPPQQN